MPEYTFPVTSPVPIPNVNIKGIREDGLVILMDFYYSSHNAENDTVSRISAITIQNADQCKTHTNLFLAVRLQLVMCPPIAINENWNIQLISATNTLANYVHITISKLDKPMMQEDSAPRKFIRPVLQPSPRKPSQKPSPSSRVVEIDDDEDTEKIESEKNKVRFYQKSIS